MRPKDQGTAEETWAVNWFRGLGFPAGRLPEGGANDVGDVLVELPSGDFLVVEVKSRSNLVVHRAVQGAHRKAMAGHLDVLPLGGIVWWKRLVRKDGKQRRVPDGETRVVSMNLEVLEALLKGGG